MTTKLRSPFWTEFDISATHGFIFAGCALIRAHAHQNCWHFHCAWTHFWRLCFDQGGFASEMLTFPLRTGSCLKAVRCGGPMHIRKVNISVAHGFILEGWVSIRAHAHRKCWHFRWAWVHFRKLCFDQGPGIYTPHQPNQSHPTPRQIQRKPKCPRCETKH